MKFRLLEAENLIDKEVNVEELPDAAQEETEDLIDKLEAMIDFDAEVTPSELMHELDDSLGGALGDVAKGVMPQGYDILVVGRAGIGKTAQVNQWAKARGINLVSKDAKSLDKSDIGGGVAAEYDAEGNRLNQMTHLYNSEFEVLDTPGTVLFLDELNRADPETIGSLLTLIRDHEIPKQDEKKGMRKFNNLLFTVAAINPSEYYEGTNELDMASLNRFKQIDTGTNIDTLSYKAYANKKFSKDLEAAKAAYQKKPDSRITRKELTASEGRLKLLNTILNSSLFEWDDMETEQSQLALQKPCLVPRTLSSALKNSDGTKDSFLKKAEKACGTPSQEMFETILSNYKDVEDKANSALKYKNGFLDDSDEGDSIFGQESDWDKLASLL